MEAAAVTAAVMIVTETPPLFQALFHHKRSGQSAVKLRGPDGRLRVVLLGHHGSTEAQERYRQALTEHFAGSFTQVKPNVRVHSDWSTVNQLSAS